ncbi:epidermal growth factor receptor-like protein, partial [Leptotrombidium deliense]
MKRKVLSLIQVFTVFEVLVLVLSISSEKQPLVKEAKICIGTNVAISVPSNHEHHYQNLKDRYSNCTLVDGNLELTWIRDENLDLSFLENIREVTGYVLISHVDVKGIKLPNLQIIRGETLLKLNHTRDEFALMVILSKMKNLEMPALRDILSGNVGFFNNYNLCHIRTIKWEEILTGLHAKSILVYNFTKPESDCPACHESCTDGCWGEGASNCQKFSKMNCSPQCYKGRCFGPKPRECCHSFCAGGCKGPKPSDCLACRNFDDNGVCKQQCPPILSYNMSTYSWETNPEGKYAYGVTCVKDCPDHLFKDNGVCVSICPANKKSLNGECVSCNGPCPKNCSGVDIVHSGNIDSFKGCTVIEGSLTILDKSFDGFHEVHFNSSFGPRHPKMSPQKLNVFNTLRVVTGYVSIQASHPEFRNLSYFRNLETIGGRQLTDYFSAFYIFNTSLISLNLRSLRNIRNGSVTILKNRQLCLANRIDWTQVVQSKTHYILLQCNGDEATCRKNGLVCHSECTNDGCWGPGSDECRSCKSYTLGNICVDRCNTSLGLYEAGGQVCKHCDEECLGECFGPGPRNCSQCRNVRDGSFCGKECPKSKYNDNGECRPCHNNCIFGCTGSNNTLGIGGCNSCEKAIMNLYNPNVVEKCLKAEDLCPDGFYNEYIGPHEEGPLKYMTGKSVCRVCHKRCKRCTAYGMHKSVCECMNYSGPEHCLDQCPSDYYADEENRRCVKCADECRGCKGPGISACVTCRNYRVYSNQQKTHFNCTVSCPSEMPFKIIDDKTGDAFCSNE